MHSKSLNLGKSISLALFALFAGFVIFISLPSIVNAQTSSLGSEEPYIYFVYEKNGEQVDGNNLEAGEYNVSVFVSDYTNSSVLEVTANYDTEKVSVAPEPVMLLSDNAADVESMGYLLENGKMVFGFVSTNEENTAFTDSDVLIAELKITFAEACDAADYITVSDNPNFTFAQVNYTDGYNDEYSLALNSDYSDYNGILYLMTCDVTPGFGHSVRGSLVVMTNNRGATNGIPVVGEYTVSVYADQEKTKLIKEVKSSNNETENYFVIDQLSDGTYYASITSTYAIERDDVIIKVNGSDILANPIPIIACDFNRDKKVNTLDASPIYSISVMNADNAYYNLDGNSTINVLDAAVVYTCIGNPAYDSITIE